MHIKEPSYLSCCNYMEVATRFIIVDHDVRMHKQF